ncbi:hypothetical protein CK203_092317 [Vitis vinifera]|uniref:Uncharacterized protein n=1 Tax=Vitis vinifera TaxID=29760 RepID=A0A438FJF7_VITVI|nr:hypothetical protein CK203_092317 [Vitis vinifera]
MMRRIINNTLGHPLKNQKILMPNDCNRVACSQGKLIIKPSVTKVEYESPTFLERIQGDICGPIHPPSGPFCYFMVLIDASTRWSHVCLLSTRNIAFAKLLAQIIRLKAQFPDHSIKKIRLDNVAPPQRSKLGPQRLLDIYVGFNSPSIIRYLEPVTEVQRIVHLQGLANQLPDAFTDIKKVTKSHVLAVNAPARIDVPKGQLENVIANESKTRLKRGSNDETQLDKQLAPEEAQIDQIPVSRIEEISMSHTGETKDRSDIIIDNIFAFQVAMDIMRNDEYQEPQTMNECRKMKDWPK